MSAGSSQVIPLASDPVLVQARDQIRLEDTPGYHVVRGHRRQIAG